MKTKSFILSVIFALFFITAQAATIVRLGPEYFPDPTKGRPVSSGSLYIGEPDTDPTVVSNQITVSAVQEDGTTVAISQPISTGAGGVPLYLGSPVILTVSESYSLKLLDPYGSQVYYVANNFAQDVSELLFLSDYACDIAAAIADIGAVVDAELIIDCECIIASGTTVTVTDNISLNVINGGSFDGVSGGGIETLALSGTDPMSGSYKIFGDNVTVTGLKKSLPELWGIDGVADDVQINKAIQALTRGAVMFENKRYTLADPIIMKQNVVLAGAAGSRNYGNEAATSYVTELYQGDASKDAIQVDGYSVLFSGLEIKDLDITGNTGTGKGLSIIGGTAGTGFAVEGINLSNVTISEFDGAGGKGIYVEGSVFRGGFYNVTAHNNEANFYCTDDTYSGTPSSLSFYNCSFRCSNSNDAGFDYNWYNDSGGGFWGFYNCDFSKAQNAGTTAIAFYNNGQGVAVACNFEHSDVGAQIAAQGFTLIGCTANDTGKTGYQLSAANNEMVRCTSTSLAGGGNDVVIDAGANNCRLSFNVAPSTLTIDDNATGTTYPDRLHITNDGTLGSTDRWIPRVKSTVFNIEEQTPASSSNAVVVDVSNGTFLFHTLTENTTFAAPTNAESGDVLFFRVLQSAGNSYTYALNAVYKNNISVPVTVTAAKSDTLMFINRGGTNWVQLGYEHDID